jgi:DNA modification methylase
MPETTGSGWTLYEDDCVERLDQLAPQSVDLTVFSPPFLSLYVYSDSPRDLGNCSTREEFYTHFGFVVRGLRRVIKPGRLVACHVAQVALQKARDGAIALEDFRGSVIRLFTTQGWHYHGEVCIDKDPQAQAIRTKSKGLLFVQLRRDASWSRPALADYILLFRDPGDNLVPIHPDITNDQWIEWARPIWYGIVESETLSAREGRGDDDERHIAPLQLGTIERCIRLWSNPGELVLSPFAGIGSEGYVAIRTGRRFVGIELKPEYAATAVKNLRRAEQLRHGQAELAL